MHKSPTELPQNAQWRMATALRLGATPDAGPRSTCALKKRNDGDMCEQSLATHPSHPFCCKHGGARNRPHRAVLRTLRRLIEQVGGYGDMERHVPELYDWVKKSNDAAPEMRCAILDVVSWFPGVLQQLWIDVSVRCPHAERYNESASKPGATTVAGEAEKTQWNGRASVGLRDVWKGGEGTKLLRGVVTTAAANGQCSPQAAGRWRTQLERVLLTAQADTYLRALGSRVAERPAAEPPLLLAEQSLYSSVWRCWHCDSHVKVRLTDRETERHRETSRVFPLFVCPVS